MKMMNWQHYRPFEPVALPDRRWPEQRLTTAPEWVSVDLRDGNQALEVPMSLEQKLAFFHYLVDIGFKTIEIGFPAASETEFEFTRRLIEDKLIPDDVAIQVLTQSRPHIIDRTFEALRGAKRAVVHLYNSTSELQRDVVFGMTREACRELAEDGARLIRSHIESDPSMRAWQLEYSPESFSGTEPDFAVEICDAVYEIWAGLTDEKVIMNLPGTVEMSMPNVYADQIEWFCRHTRYRDQIRVSLHTHNDRGTGIAATELGLLAGADRVEGTLFGNGERTGNADILTLALHLFSQGIDPKLDFTDINRAIEIYEISTNMQVHPRHPYAGDLVYTAFSGSHQDAINKGLARRSAGDTWNVPYLPIDPHDVGRSYEPIIRINSQSGRGGVSYIMEQHFGYQIPKPMQRSFSEVVTKHSDRRQDELRPVEILELFHENYLNLRSPLELISWEDMTLSETEVAARGRFNLNGEMVEVSGRSNGVLGAIAAGLSSLLGQPINITLYHQHALTQSSDSKALTYIGLTSSEGKIAYGAGLSGNITKSSIRGLVSAINQLLREEPSFAAKPHAAARA